MELSDPRLAFLAPGWERLRIAMCERCTGFGTVLTEVDRQGGSRWSSHNVRPRFIGDEDHAWNFPQRRLVLGQGRSPFEAHQYVLTSGGSQIGGFPMWMGGEPHPDCPKCRRAMVFIGQVQTDDVFGEPSEGVTYAFLCRDCGMAATTYTQT